MKRGLRNGLRVERVQAGGRAREEGEKSPLRFLFFTSVRGTLGWACARTPPIHEPCLRLIHHDTAELFHPRLLPLHTMRICSRGTVFQAPTSIAT